MPLDRLPILVWALAAGIQIALAVLVIIFPLAPDLWDVRRNPARVRSARLGFGDDFSGYIEFLKGEIPEDALVVIPPAEHNSRFGHMGLMQYFLFPRRLANCPSTGDWEACKLNYDGGNTFLVSVGGFPSPNQRWDLKEYIAFDQDHGLFIPAGFLP